MEYLTAGTSTPLRMGCRERCLHSHSLKLTSMLTWHCSRHRSYLRCFADGLGANPSSSPEHYNSDSYMVVGHPLGASLMATTIKFRQPAIVPLSDLLPDDMLWAIAEIGSPYVRFPVLSIEGTIVPGESGAPILSNTRELVGILGGTQSQPTTTTARQKRTMQQVPTGNYQNTIGRCCPARSQRFR